MSIIKKRLFALLMTMVMALSLSVSAFAAEPSNIITEDPATLVSEEVSTRSSLGKVIAAGATTIYDGSGTLNVALPSGNFFADIVAQIGYADQNGIVTCSVLTPDGTTISLGNIVGTGSRTYAYELLYAPAGTYRFYFTSTISTPYEVAAFIYD